VLDGLWVGEECGKELFDAAGVGGYPSGGDEMVGSDENETAVQVGEFTFQWAVDVDAGGPRSGVTHGELDPGALGVAAPVRDEYHRVVAGLSVIAPGQRAPQTRIAELVDLVNAAAERLGSQLALISQ